MDGVAFFFGLLFLLPASVHDFRTREVPDLLSYAFIIFALLYGLARAILLSSWIPLLQSLIGFGAMLLLGILLYYTGQWGGADSKLLFALGALLGLGFGDYDILLFLVLMLFAGALYGITYTIVLAAKHRKVILRYLKKRIREPIIHRLRFAVIIVCFLLLGAAFFSQLADRFLLLGFTILLYTFFYLWLLVKAVEEKVLIKPYKVGELTEGDWINEEVKVKGKVLAGSKNLGVTKEQIALLKKYKVKRVIVKEGIPFVPSFLLGLLLLWFLSSWFSTLVVSLMGSV